MPGGWGISLCSGPRYVKFVGPVIPYLLAKNCEAGALPRLLPSNSLLSQRPNGSQVETPGVQVKVFVPANSTRMTRMRSVPLLPNNSGPSPNTGPSPAVAAALAPDCRKACCAWRRCWIRARSSGLGWSISAEKRRAASTEAPPPPSTGGLAHAAVGCARPWASNRRAAHQPPRRRDPRNGPAPTRAGSRNGAQFLKVQAMGRGSRWDCASRDSSCGNSPV